MFTWHHYDKRSIREIAHLLKRSHSTISREFKRNISTHYVPTWYPHYAQQLYTSKKRSRSQRPLLKNTETRQFVTEKLKLGWTPEIIAGRLKHENNLAYTCHESIYQFIYKKAPELIHYLPRQHKKRRKKFPSRKYQYKISNKLSILNRPEAINARQETGHWETDSIVSHQNKPGCNVLVERKTRLMHISKLNTKTSSETAHAIIGQLKRHPSTFVKSITYDNGQENAKHFAVNASLKCVSYFCQAYHSWEKGSVENINSLIRRFIPKKTDITKISSDELDKIEELLNSRPRKCLDYKTPYEAYNELYGALDS
jgi:IS30 family transposase